MMTTDLLLSISSICFVICAIPQLVRNWKYKDTITQSLIMNGMILIGTVLTAWAYVLLHVTVALFFIIVEAVITAILICQIVIWRNNKRKLKAIKKTESARSVWHALRGLR